MGLKAHPVKDAIPQIGLGDRAKPGNGPRFRHGFGLMWHHLGGVDQAPARVDPRFVEQPFDGAPAAPCEAVVDLALQLRPGVIRRIDRLQRPDGHQIGPALGDPGVPGALVAHHLA